MSKSSNDSGANDSSIVGAVIPAASAARDSAVFDAAATRATKAAIAPVLPVVDAGSGVAADATAGAVPPALSVGAEVAQRPDVDAEALDDAGAAAGMDVELVALTDGIPMVGVGAAIDARPAADAAPAGNAAGDEAPADELPGRVGRGGGFAAGGGDAAGAGRAGGTVGIADFEMGLLTVAGRGAVLALAADGVTGRLAPGVAPEGSCAAGDAECGVDGDCAADEPVCDVDEADCAADEPVCDVDEADCATDVDGAAETGRPVDEAAVPVVGVGREPAAGRTLEVVVEITGRAPAPAVTDPAGERATGPDCTEPVDAPPVLAARSLAAAVAAATRAAKSETALSVEVAVREAEPATALAGAFAAGALGAVPLTAGIPNPAGDEGFPAEGDWPVVGAAEAGGGFTDGAADADVDACDVAPGAGADAPLPAESVSTGPSGSNNWSSPRSSSESCSNAGSEDTPAEGLATGADVPAASFNASSSRSESPVPSRLSGSINSCAGSSGFAEAPTLREEAPEDGDDVAPMGTLPSIGASTGRSVSGSKTGRDAASIVSSPR